MLISDKLLQMLQEEHERATRTFPRYNSAHEALAVLQEEFEELKAEVHKSPTKRNIDHMREEAIQVAVVALRLVDDITGVDNKESKLSAWLNFRRYKV